MAKCATKATAGTPTPVMVNKGLPWIFILVMSVLLLLAVFGLRSGFNGASGSFLPAFSIFWLAGVILFASGGWMIYKLKIVRGLILILLALVAFQIPGTTSGKELEKSVVSTPATIAEKAGNLLVTGTTKSPADIAAARKAEAERVAREEKARKDEELHQAKVRGTEAAAYDAEAAKNLPLTEVAFTTNTLGKFVTLKIKSGQRVGPINDYDVSCLSWSKSGTGMLNILSRPDFTSKPVLATLTDREYGIKEWGHTGVAYQLFFEAKQGDIQIELERHDGDGSC